MNTLIVAGSIALVAVVGFIYFTYQNTILFYLNNKDIPLS